MSFTLELEDKRKEGGPPLLTQRRREDEKVDIEMPFGSAYHRRDNKISKNN